jgi:hypothetical protein
MTLSQPAAAALERASHPLHRLFVAVLGPVGSGCILLLLRLVSLYLGRRRRRRDDLLALMELSGEVYLHFVMGPGREDVSSTLSFDISLSRVIYFSRCAGIVYTSV